MYFHDRCHVEETHFFHELRNHLFFQRRRYQKDGIGPGPARLVYLVLVYDKILAQYGQRGILLYFLYILKLPVKKLFVGNYRYGPRARSLVILGYFFYAYVRLYGAFGRRLFLYLRDYGEIIVLKNIPEIPVCRRLGYVV